MRLDVLSDPSPWGRRGAHVDGRPWTYYRLTSRRGRADNERDSNNSIIRKICKMIPDLFPGLSMLQWVVRIMGIYFKI